MSSSSADASDCFDPPAVAVDDVSFRFQNGPPILNSVSLAANAGDFVALVGPSGCGKSTLLRMIAGLLAPSQGAIRFDRSSAGPPRRAFVFQHANLMPWQTTLQNVALPLELSGASRREAVAVARERLALVGLSPADEGKLPDQLSGGMQMRVSIARALSVRPEILLLDEPFGALDEVARRKLHQEIQRLHASERRTTFFVTHDVSEALFLADRAIVFTGSPGQVAGEIVVPFERPRGEDLYADPTFAALCGKTGRLLRESAREGGAA
ncbi:MAG TPA: ABC transporter ATP-binding protein [Pirellulaceae bacterium]|jgi:NitT/TauT family transport system ATP-binding protein|nr:ABC transporter ATP-binding protein [Pirellulaceae bacterium]